MQQIAVKALGQIRDDRAVNALVDALNDKDSKVRQNVIVVLEAMESRLNNAQRATLVSARNAEKVAMVSAHNAQQATMAIVRSDWPE